MLNALAEKRKPADEAVKRQSMQDNEDEGEEEEEEKVEDQEMVDAEASKKDEAEPEEK